MEEGVGIVHRKAAEFGTANSSREEVMKFYQEWGGFSTMKQFAYVDQYNPNDAPNRRIKRLIEQDNKRERYKERGRFNIRNTGFIKKYLSISLTGEYSLNGCIIFLRGTKKFIFEAMFFREISF